MIYLIGDIHGGFEWIPNLLKDIPEEATVIQVGDFGFWPHIKELWASSWKLSGRKNPIYAIDGNHEYFPLFAGITEPTEIWEGVIYIPRGTVMEIDGKRIGLIGGAESPDKILRKLDRDWFMEEAISRDDFEKLYNAEKCDILVTHTAPLRHIEAHFPHPAIKFPSWRLPPDWKDPSAVAVEQLWKKHGRPPLYCGHLHKAVELYPGPVRILDVNEVLKIEHD